MTSGHGSKIVLSHVPGPAAEGLCEFFEADLALAVTATGISVPAARSGDVSIEFYCSATINLETASKCLSSVAGEELMQRIELRVETLEARDWVAESQAMLSPIEAGRFFVHGSHDRHRRPRSAIGIEIEAGQAFGTGHHATTEGCLFALDGELKRATPRRILDLGCGSGILAIAAASAAKTTVIATDIDPIAIEVAQANAEKNAVGGWVRACVAAGTGHRLIQAHAPYDIIFANILARPLIALAPDVKSVLAKGGRAILSGLTLSQAAGVISAYRLQGLRLERRITLNEWSTLLMRH